MATDTLQLEADTSDRDKAKAAQQARAKKYHIAVKDGGNITKPGEWANLDDSAFGDPVNYRYPMADKAHADNAASRWGDVSNRSQYSSAEQKIIGDRIAARQRHFGTKAAKDDSDKQETTPSESAVTGVSGSSSGSSSFHPRSRIASVQVRWISDGARSVNGRIYPAETVSRLIASGQRKLADSNELPITCFLSHADADSDHTPALIGKATKIWRSGSDGMALIDFADTTHARDALGLIVGKYICTESLRASNAELRTDPRYDVPVVVGDRIELDGIDLTNYPGLEAVARIQQVHLAEAVQRSNAISEVFDLAPTALEIHQPGSGQGGQSMSKSLNEAVPPGGNTVGGYTPTSGEAPYMTNDNPDDSYHQSMYKQPDMTSGVMQGMMGTTNPEAALDVQEAHDRIAMVQGRTCAPARESARWKAAYAGLSLVEQAGMALREAGRALSAKNEAHLDIAHHKTAKVLGMDCEGKNNKMGSIQPADDGMQDGDDDDKSNESARPRRAQKENSMTPDEAARLLEAAGYTIQKPKTEAELLKEQIAAMQAEQAREKEERAKQMEEMKALIAQRPTYNEPVPQRRSQVLGANVGESTGNQHRPLHGRYLQEKIKAMDWERMAYDRTTPLPTDTIPLDLLMREFEHMYALSYDDWAERVYNISPIYASR